MIVEIFCDARLMTLMMLGMHPCFRICRFFVATATFEACLQFCSIRIGSWANTGSFILSRRTDKPTKSKKTQVTKPSKISLTWHFITIYMFLYIFIYKNMLAEANDKTEMVIQFLFLKLVHYVCLYNSVPFSVHTDSREMNHGEGLREAVRPRGGT